ncbi:MAG TPA: hypothetical protein VGG74_05510 [Kofleriaceae bacterium]
MLGQVCVVVAALVAAPAVVHAQACCAGSSAVTPGRLALHEDALVGIDARATAAYGSFDPTGTFVATPPGASEQDFEEDLFAAIRFAGRAQAALLVPIVETRRTTSTGSELGGGIGDVNASVRYDFVYASEAHYVPGIALLAGVTFPTGTPPEDATTPLATGATGVGAYQGNLGISFEKVMGPWLFGATGLVAKRSTRNVDGVTSALASQWTALALAAYTFHSESAIALSGSFTEEGNAAVDGITVPSSFRRLVAFTLSGVVPLSDRLRLQGAVTVDPPASSFGVNQPSAGVGGTATVIYAWL